MKNQLDTLPSGHVVRINKEVETSDYDELSEYISAATHVKVDSVFGRTVRVTKKEARVLVAHLKANQKPFVARSVSGATFNLVYIFNAWTCP